MNRRRVLQGCALTGLSGMVGGNVYGNSNQQSVSDGVGRSLADEPPPELYVPPEEHPHTCTFMQWPSSRAVYPERGFLAHIQRTIAQIANTIAEFEPVILLSSKAEYRQAKRMLSNSVEHWDIATDDLWCRDSGPLFAFSGDGDLVVSHLAFNGWGNKQQHANDGAIASRVAERLQVPLVSSGLTGEAGGVEHDGHGLLMAHESSWIIDNRNPGLSRAVIEQRLLQAYGATRMIWMPGLAGQDITDYHIDSLARFTGAARVLINLPEHIDISDDFHRAAVDSFNILSASGVEVDVIYEPGRTRIGSEEFVASYANYYACNGGVIAASFGDSEADEQAVVALQRHYPEREIVTLNVDALGEVGGGIHCATQQMPASL